MNHTDRRIFLLFLILFSYPLLSASEEIYRWTDEEGTIHFTDDPSTIPKPYLQRGEKIQFPQEKGEDVRQPIKPADRSDRVEKYLKEMDQKIEAKKKLENKISTLERDLSFIEERLKAIEDIEKEDFQYYQPFRDPKSGRWVNVASPYYDEKRRLESRRQAIKGELESLQEELSKIKRSL